MTTKRVHIFITGFLQRRERPTGMETLWLKVHNAFPADLSYSPLAWRHNWSAVAEQLHRVSQAYDTLDIRVYAYSWGVGYGLNNLAKQLKKRGLKINAAVCCDPVWHHWFQFWRVLLPGTPAVRLPDNICEAWYLYQRQNKPSGEAGVVGPVVVHEPYEVHTTHAYADDSSTFHKVALKVAAYD